MDAVSPRHLTKSLCIKNMKIPKNIIPCPACKVRNEYNAYKDMKAHAKGWKNKFICPTCQAHLKQRWSTIVFSLVAVGITGYLTFFTDFKYSFITLLVVLASMFFLLYFGFVFKAEENA